MKLESKINSLQSTNTSLSNTINNINSSISNYINESTYYPVVTTYKVQLSTLGNKAITIAAESTVPINSIIYLIANFNIEQYYYGEHCMLQVAFGTYNNFLQGYDYLHKDKYKVSARIAQIKTELSSSNNVLIRNYSSPVVEDTLCVVVKSEAPISIKIGPAY